MAPSQRSSRSTSPSEGEILESGSEKANTITITSNDSAINRHSRDHVSTAPSAVPRKSTGVDRSRDWSRDRSRSPYRESHNLKRQHASDHYRNSEHDPRRFKLHYESSKENQRDRGRGPSRDTIRTADSIRHQGGELDRSLRAHHNQPRHHRDRSHPRFKTPLDYEHRGHGRSTQVKSQDKFEQRDELFIRNPERNIEDLSVSIQSQESRPDKSYLSHKAEYDDGQATRDDPRDGNISASDQNKSVASGNHEAINADRSSSFLQGASKFVDGDSMTNEAPVDESVLIEERRKRREAIMAKHRDQSAHEPVQVLDPDGQAEQRVSSRLDTRDDAKTLQSSSTVGSVNFGTGQERTLLLNQVIEQEKHIASKPTKPEDFDSALEEDPSAVDYDPKMDMQETKLRQDYLQLPFAKDSIIPNQSKAYVPESPLASHESIGKVNSQFDMFADSEDMDMFVEGPAQTQHAEHQVLNPNTASKIQAADMGMLDDWDDADGYYKVKLGELLDGRYHVQSNLGKGMFSGVVRATDQNERQTVAIKIVRNNDTMHKAGMKEIAILQNLKNADPEDRKHLIRLERHFEHKGHLCMVFENLSINLREVLKKFGRDVGINIRAVRIYAQQMFLGLSLLRKCNVLHADLKPDNVLVNDSRNVLKICDLGSASDASENEITQYLVSRFYRAPEIILGCPYDFSIDMWSIGCTLFELYTGKILFTGRNNNQMLRMMMDCRGKFGQKMLRRGQYTSAHFDDLLNFRSVEKDRLTGKDVVRLMNITKPTRDLRSRLLAGSKGVSDAEMKELHLFADLLDRCLSLNPEKRCTPHEALKHPFITRQKI